jgi:hypothetical protein
MQGSPADACQFALYGLQLIKRRVQFVSGLSDVVKRERNPPKPQDSKHNQQSGNQFIFHNCQIPLDV